MIDEELLLKIIIKEMPDHPPWDEDEWGTDEDEAVKSCFRVTLFDHENLRGQIFRFVKNFIGNTAVPFTGPIPNHIEQKLTQCDEFTNLVIKKYRAYQMIPDKEMHDIMDI